MFIEVTISPSEKRILSVTKMVSREYTNSMNDIWDDGEEYPGSVEPDFYDELKFIDSRLTNVYGVGMAKQQNDFDFYVSEMKVLYFRCYEVAERGIVVLYLEDRPDLIAGASVDIVSKKYRPKQVQTDSGSLCSGDKIEKPSDYLWMILDYIKG